MGWSISFNIILLSSSVIFAIYGVILNKDIDDSKCKRGIKLFFTLNQIITSILRLNNNSLSKSIIYIKKEINNMKINTDYMSKNNLEKQKNMLISILKCRKLVKDFTKEQIYNNKKYTALLPIIKRRYYFYNNFEYNAEVFYYKHGIIYFNDKLLNYIYNRDIMDIGAWIGDSLIVLENYTRYIIYSYEISMNNIRQLKNNIKINHLHYNKHKIIHKGLSNYNGVKYIIDSGSAGVGINSKGGLKVNITTIDEEVKKYNLSLGFIKADVEGNGLELIKGAKDTILKHLPVISISIYHSYNEYFCIRKYLNSITTLYTYKYILANFCEPFACEFSLIAYPKNL